MTVLDPNELRRLAADTLPTLFFSDKEAFFPVRAESWLTHTSTAPWGTETDPDDIGALNPDRHHRGTCLIESGDDIAHHKQIAGPPNPRDEPLRVETSGAGEAIGNVAYSGRPDPDRELFLSFAGWKDPDQPHRGGDIDYLRAAFSELASAINHDVIWDPIATRPNRPFFGQPQPVSPAVYCEIDWAGAHFRVSPPVQGLTSTALDQYIQVTYHYLFPARTPLANQPNVRTLEGQWAAISLFYHAAIDVENLDENQRPLHTELRDNARPVWVVFSLDSENWNCSVHQFGQGETQVFAPPNTPAAHVAAWVGAGTHRFFRDASAEVPLGPNEPWPDLDYEPGDDMEGIFPAVLPGMMGKAVGGDVFAIIISGLLGVWDWWLLAWLINLITEWWDDDASTSDIPRSGDAPINSNGGVGDPSYGNAAAPDVGQPDAHGWQTNEGSPDGWDVAFFDMKVISQIKAANHGEAALDPPPWWSYTGRWGIKTPPESSWASGTRRSDEQGRSWAYWMAWKLYSHMVQSATVAGP